MTDETTEFLEAPATTPVPPLRIHHILVATAVTAIVLALATVLKRDGSSNLGQEALSPSGTLQLICTSLALTALGFGVSWRRRGIPFFQQPGHWLLVTQAMGVWLLGVVIYVLVAGPPSDPARLGTVAVPFFFVSIVGSLTANVWALARVADSVGWKLSFGFEVCAPIAMILILILAGMTDHAHAVNVATGVVHQATPPLSFVFLAGAAIGDRIGRRRRDWPHWLAVRMGFATDAFELTTQAVEVVKIVTWDFMSK